MKAIVCGLVSTILMGVAPVVAQTVGVAPAASAVTLAPPAPTAPVLVPTGAVTNSSVLRMGTPVTLKMAESIST